jgi:Bacterial membrane protein YfhO
MIESSPAPVGSHPRWHRAIPDVLGIGWVVAAAVAMLLPALVHGIYLGPYDILSTNGLTAQHGGTVHNFSLRDQIALFIPFTDQAWTQVHHGHLPLWNPYNGLGMPLAFNWESAPFGLPALFGYLVPLRDAYTVGVLVTVVVAGTGGYVFGRVLRLSAIGSAFVGTVFVLSGSMVSLLGWSATSVGSWSGWLFAGAVLVIRGKRRALAVTGFAVALTMAIYAGHPETLLLVLLALAVFVVIVLVCRAPGLGSSGPILRPAVDLVAGGLAGFALAAPLLLPGMQLIAQSGRSSTGNYDQLTTPDHGVLQLLFQGFDGLPVAGSHWFGSLTYQWCAAYVGVIAVVMAVVALGTRWKRPEVRGLTVATALMAMLVLVPGVPSAVKGFPLVGEVILSRALIPLAFGLSVLAGIGLDALIRHYADPRVRMWAGGCFVVVAAALALVWSFGRGQLPPDEMRIRDMSFVWPVISVAVGLAVVGGLGLAVRRGGGFSGRLARLGAGVLLVCETSFLVAAGAPLMSSSPNPPAATPVLAAFQRQVGKSLVGLGTESCIASTFFGAPGQGILPQANMLFDIHEFAMYDPLAPNAYYSVWHSLTGSAGGDSYYYQFCPAVSSVKAARRFGVSYILEPHNDRGPAGSSFVEALGNEDLYRVRGAAAATLVPARAGRPLPSEDALGRPVVVLHPNPATWSVVTDAATPQVLRLRITDVPGWHATIDGHPLQLQQFSGLMLQARIPPGRHSIMVDYWPTTFSIGLVLAACTALALLVVNLLASRRHRKISTAS